MNNQFTRQFSEETGFFPYPSLPLVESRQESPSNSTSPIERWEYAMNNNDTNDANTSYDEDNKWTNSATSTPGRINHNIWSTDTSSFTNGYYRGSNDVDSLYTTSTYASMPRQDQPRGPPPPGMEHLDTFKITSSMGLLTVGHQEQQLQQPFFPGGIVSVPSMASGTSYTVPGIVGVSSGSTGGSTTRSLSTWNDGSTRNPPQPSVLKNPMHHEVIGFTPQDLTVPNNIPNLASSSLGLREEESVQSWPDKQQGPSGYRKSQKKSRSNRRNNNRSNNNSKSGRGGRTKDDNNRDGTDDFDSTKLSVPAFTDDYTAVSSQASSEAIRLLMGPPMSTTGSAASSQASYLTANRLPLDRLVESTPKAPIAAGRPILPAIEDSYPAAYVDDEVDESIDALDTTGDDNDPLSPSSKKDEWLLRMNRRMNEIPVGQLDPATVPIAAIMNAWAKTKSSQGASMVEMWLNRIQKEADAGNSKVAPNTKLYTMAVDAWAKSGEGVIAAQRAEAILQSMYDLYQKTGKDSLRPTTGIFNAVINAWARSKEKAAPARAEQILQWMDNLHRSNPTIQVRPDKFTYNTVIHAYAKSGGTVAATKAQELLANMHKMHEDGNVFAKPDTITYNVVINAWAKSGGKGAAAEAEKLLARMQKLHASGDPDIKPNVVTYGAVIDSYAKCGEKGAAAKADTLLAKMIQLYQSDPVKNGDLRPNTYVFNTVINCWAKSKEPDAASKAEEMLLAMSKLHASGMPNLKPDAFTYTAVIDAWSKSGYRGAAARADQLLDKMEAKYLAGDLSLRPNSFTYNAVINALAKSGEPGAAARAERVLQNMVNRHRQGGSEDCKPTTINFNTILDAWAKSGGGRQAAERAEEILEWMDRLHKAGNADCQPDTISFNAVIDAWARSGDRMAPHRAEQILDHMDELYRAGDVGKKPDVYSYNTLINAWAKSTERGSAARAEHVLRVMKQRYADGDKDFKPNTRTMTSVIDAWAKSGEKGAAKRAEQIFKKMIASYEATADPDIKPNVHTANAVCNACAFTKIEEDRSDALKIAFGVFEWILSQPDMEADSYTYTILLSVCANLIPRENYQARFQHAKELFEKCCAGGYVNEFVLRKLRQTVSTEEYIALTGTHGETTTDNLPHSWTRSFGHFARVQLNKGRKKNSGWSQRRRK